jgi:hypothetical protein
MNFPFPNLCALVRMQCFNNKSIDEGINPLELAWANFSLLFPKNRFGSSVFVCLECGVCVKNMENVEPLLVHCAVQPHCPFIKRDFNKDLIESITSDANCKDILKRHMLA